MNTSIVNGTLSLLAPVSGPLIPIEQVPDPVFAQKMVGDGISIDPLNNELLAPCSGEIIHLHPAMHAVTLSTGNGLEILLHIGVDTVELKGEGFEALVEEGDLVDAGSPLIRFDLDLLARKAKSVLTQMVISTPEKVSRFNPQSGTVTAGQDLALELALTEVQESGSSDTSEYTPERSAAILIPNATGIHARPAAVLANLAKRYDSAVQLECSGRIANAKSLTALMKLNVKQNDKAVLIATGPDAKEALAELEQAISNGLGDLDGTPVSAPASTLVSAAAAPPPKSLSDNPDLILGAAASTGLAVGFIQQLKRAEVEINEKAGTPAEEQARLQSAYEIATNDLEALQIKLHSENNSPQAAIFAAHRELLEDPELLAIAHSATAKGLSASGAWNQAYEEQAKELEQMDNILLAERAHDLRDVGRRVLLILTGSEAEKVEFKEQTILIAEDLSPSDTAQLDRNKILGFCTVHGGSTSHAAILARAMGIPAVVGAEARVLEVENGAPVILNGSSGELRLNPPAELVNKVSALREQMEVRRKEDHAAAKQPAVTTDDVRIEVVGNIGNAEEAEQIVDLGGEGVGLLRSEFLFMDRSSAPTEDEQLEAYRNVLEALPKDAPMIIRTMDVGGDKPLRYLPMPAEENPFLGVRGVRVGLQHPELLRTQIRAVLRAAAFGNVRIMFPMIASISEWREVKGMLDQEVDNLKCSPIPAGMMVEVPSAAVMAEQFAEEVDFFSIGTNDLSQYTLAMDRGHPQLAAKIDGLNPAVLSLIARTAKAGATRNKMVGVCGGIAGEVQAVPVLIGLGVTELSVSLPVIPKIKALVRKLSVSDCKDLAEKALKMNDAKEVRGLSPGPLSAQIELSAMADAQKGDDS
jgi:phosphocarrier protein FPr